MRKNHVGIVIACFALGLTAFGTRAISFGYKFISKASAETADYGTYYDKVNGTGSSLLSSVKSTISSGYHSLGYDGLYSVYPYTDDRGDGYLYDIYSDKTMYTATTKKCGNYKNPGDCHNREHTIPQSWWGGGTSNQGCDAFLVLLSDGKINGMRSNYPYGECANGEEWKMPADTETNRLGTSTSTQYITGKVFEPMESRKGDLARGYFYAIARWEAQKWTSGEGDEVFGTGTNYTNGFKNSYLQMLLKWHNEDPVSEREIKRNSIVQQYQKNRNPFIDHPSWVDLIWGGTYDINNTNAEDTKGGTAVVVNGKISGGEPVVRTLESITVSGQKTEYNVGDSFVKPTVNAYYSDGTNKVVSTATFSGFDLDIEGVQTVNVSYTESGITKTTSYSISVVIPDPEVVHVQSVSLNKTGIELYINDSDTLEVTINPSNATTKNIIWSSSNEDVASIDKGFLLALSEGETIITVTSVDGGKTATCKVTVKKYIPPKPASSGCGGNIASTSVILASFSIAAILLLVIRKKYTNK